MGILMRLSLALSLLMAAMWFGGNLVWLWIVGVGLPSGDPDVALQAASAIETAAGAGLLVVFAVLSMAAFLAAAVLSWGDQRGNAAWLLGGCVIGQLLVVAVVLGLPVRAQDASTWGDYGVREALVTFISVLISGTTLTLVGIAIWNAARSRFVSEI
ncbi:MAG: hypothetical protein AAGH17_01165 [Pseudomonadota bacterium]